MFAGAGAENNTGTSLLSFWPTIPFLSLPFLAFAVGIIFFSGAQIFSFLSFLVSLSLFVIPLISLYIISALAAWGHWEMWSIVMGHDTDVNGDCRWVSVVHFSSTPTILSHKYRGCAMFASASSRMSLPNSPPSSPAVQIDFQAPWTTLPHNSFCSFALGLPVLVPLYSFLAPL
ncbi:hypothetical protein B0H14DRAFT_2825559 [Mycena olivaceomarginata]|nr:hypothetical protein B0H14DRAFT_2825559 [Mycena olivaceomarginata]